MLYFNLRWPRLILGAIDKRTGSPIALLAEDSPDGLRFAGGAFITLRGEMRARFSEKLTGLAASRPPVSGAPGWMTGRRSSSCV
jgi:hypothetical protein